MKYGWYEKQAVLLVKKAVIDMDIYQPLLTLLHANSVEALERVEVLLWPQDDRNKLQKIIDDLEKKEKKGSKESYLLWKTDVSLYLRFQQIYVASRFYTEALNGFMGGV
jgi:hypothetical protein